MTCCKDKASIYSLQHLPLSHCGFGKVGFISDQVISECLMCDRKLYSGQRNGWEEKKIVSIDPFHIHWRKGLSGSDRHKRDSESGPRRYSGSVHRHRGLARGHGGSAQH